MIPTELVLFAEILPGLSRLASSRRVCRPNPGWTFFSGRGRRQSLDHEVSIGEHNAQLELAPKCADVFPQCAQKKIGLPLHAGNSSLGNVQSLGKSHLCLSARLPQLVKADAFESGFSLPLQVRAILRRGLVF